MATLRTYVEVALGLSIVLGVIAFLAGDWMWVIIDALCVTLLTLPFIKNLGYYYTEKVAMMAMTTPIATILLFVLSYVLPLREVMFLNVPVYEYLVSVMEAVQCFTLGFMVALLADRTYGMTMTSGWMTLFSLVFAMSVIVLDFFFVFCSLYADGYPVFNEDYANSDMTANSILMATPMSAAFTTAVLAVMLFRRLRNVDKANFTIDEEVTG